MKKLIFCLSAVLFIFSSVYSQSDTEADSSTEPVVKDLYPVNSDSGAEKEVLPDVDEDVEILDAEPAAEAAAEGAAGEGSGTAVDVTAEGAAAGALGTEAALEAADAADGTAAFDEAEDGAEGTKKSRAGISVVPAKKRPKSIDSEKAKAAAEKDENDEVPEKNKNTIRFGIPSEISTLIDQLTSDDDPRFTDDIYDLFQVTKNTVIQQKCLEYFTKMEDPCLEDFAVDLMNDPYDAKKDVVHAAFLYIQKVKTEAAIPAVLTLLEGENEAYFNDALSTIGEIGSSEEAVFLSEYLDRDDLSDAQRQALMRTLGKLHATETYDKIVEILENEDENTFVRMYAAEGLGFMEKEEAVPVLINAFTATDPNLRQYAIKGLSHFPKVVEAQKTIIQAIRDEHWKVRQEAIKACEEMKLKDSIPYLKFRVENDSENVIKTSAVVALSKMDDSDAIDFLVGLLDKKISDSVKVKAISALLDADKGESEILENALKWASDVKYKSLCKETGKLLAKHSKGSYEAVCEKYLESKDSDIINLGIDMYKNHKMGGVEEQMRKIAADKTANSTNRNRIKKLLGIEDEKKE